jgi:antitoxin Xre/MbcA/ParS-like protein
MPSRTSAIYPRSRVSPPPLADLTDKRTRERLSGPATRAFFNIMARWQVRDEDARALLGGMSNGPYYELKRHPDKTLDVDRLTRMSLLVGIFKALHILHAEALADRWVHLPNSGEIFGGDTPLAFMVRGGVPALVTIRRLLDARRSG